MSNKHVANFQTRIEEEHRYVNGVDAKAIIPYEIPVYTERYDIEGTTIYVGQALPTSITGSAVATSDAVWSIQKFDLSDLTVGTGLMTMPTAVWDNRTSEVYY